MSQDRGAVLWFTGLSGAGKSTIANVVAKHLRERGHKVEILDGDEIRENLSKGLGFSREDRDINIRRIGYVAKLLARNGVIVITAAISPYRSVRNEVRAMVEGFIEVYVKTSLKVCIQRDVKGLYKKAIAGEIKQFTGISDPYEEPATPELAIETEGRTPDESAAEVLAYVERSLAASGLAHTH